MYVVLQGCTLDQKMWWIEGQHFILDDKFEDSQKTLSNILALLINNNVLQVDRLTPPPMQLQKATNLSVPVAICQKATGKSKQSFTDFQFASLVCHSASQ